MLLIWHSELLSYFQQLPYTEIVFFGVWKLPEIAEEFRVLICITGRRFYHTKITGYIIHLANIFLE